MHKGLLSKIAGDLGGGEGGGGGGGGGEGGKTYTIRDYSSKNLNFNNPPTASVGVSEHCVS